MKPFEVRNAHFDRLVNTPDLRWMGQNTNHAKPHAAVIEAMERCIRDEEFHVYAPPAGLEELRQGIVSDLDLKDHAALVSDGAVSSLYHVCHTLLQPGDEFITTDPTWNWPMAFARSVGATVKQIPIYGAEYGYRLAPERLAAAITPKTRIVYLVDPNNPLGTACTSAEIESIAAIAKAAGAYLIHDCTYRHFAHSHELAAKHYPDRTLTIYSFSKWLGLAGLRVGAVVADPDLIERLAGSPPNNLGSSILSQRAALAGLKIKSEWFPGVLTQQRANQKLINDAVTRIPGLEMPVYPSNGNFIIIECEKAGVKPEALVAAFQERKIMIRQGAYHTPTFGDRFIKVSTSVPSLWVEEFVALLPAMVERARGRNEPVKLF
ncbi:MAG: pyridoxal phosphate-dependent aminotransferase [Bradyrhizobium sp.]|jgi:aspartate/methionine/tyrosine aminotransferase|uniref:pyridoxal phosphate-dependent aminotransferase n=1 Tax=Bradyrhizobium sp. TaxID=376 RepID=UPI0011F962DB|nr:pyridoxal phosphate-dependent aminotransferase [Bradyrhizobium sp.]THD57533.1 MAG: pyridoxal phosphate-dependent aminotransferase [Bradyrhizobium sp.]